MDRKAFKLPFRKDTPSKYQYPVCGKGSLNVKLETFNKEETKLSISAHKYDEWDPEWIEYVYSCLFECTNTACKEIIASSGVGSVSQYYCYDDDGNPDTDWDDFFKPKYFAPHLKMFKVPKGIPEEVDEEINKSFALLFCDPASAANHVRISLEHLLTHLKIKRYTTNGGKRRFLPLHNRIDLLPRKYAHVQEIFFAVKWLGNAGSHSTKRISLDDVLDSYELMNELLKEIFANTRTRAKKLAKTINKKKGPK